MKAKILCFICIICLSLSMSGCCHIINQVFVTPTPVPSATPTPTATATPSATPTSYIGTITPSPVQSTYVQSYDVSLAAQTGDNNTIKITNLGGAGTQYLKYLTVTNNGVLVHPDGLTTQKGSVGTFVSNASANHIVVTGVFIDGSKPPLLDTVLQK